MNTGYATTRNNVYKTMNKGQTWDTLPLIVGAVSPAADAFEHAHFWSRDSGILITNNPVKIYKTTDGGQDWDTTYPLISGSGYDAILGFSFINKDTGFITISGGFGELLKTTDRGVTWQTVSSNQYFQTLQFVNSQLGYAIRGGQLFRTVSGGVSWTMLNIPENNGLNDVWFTRPSKGFVVYDGGFIKKTIDSGNTWQYTSSSLYDNFEKIKFLNNNIG